MVHLSLIIPLGVRKLWDEWNIRGSILFSLCLQVVLIFVAPIRKSARTQSLVLLIWFAYSLADAAANFSIGLIANRQRSQCNPNPEESTDLLAFWAPFLLLHLGGQDSITAFSLEDNQLWSRHLLSLGFQTGAVFYVFVQSLPNENLWIPTVLMFIAGVIKYVERTRALFLASLDRFRNSMLKKPDPGPNYEMLMEEYASAKGTMLPTRIRTTPEPDDEFMISDIPPKEGELNPLEVVHYAYKYFQLFRGLVVDLTCSFRVRDESRDFFNTRKPEEALRIIEVELNFLYETLYTKVEVVHSIPGTIFRVIAFGANLATLGIFYFQTKKDEFRGVDIEITYTLLLGALALDVIAFLMLIFSDRTIASINLDRHSCPPNIASVFSNFLDLKKPRWHPCKCRSNEHQLLSNPLLFRRWSGAISAHNLIRYCLKSNKSNQKIHAFPSFWVIMFEKIFVVGCGKISFCKTFVAFISEVLKIFQDLKISLCKLKGSIISKVLKIFQELKVSLCKLKRSIISKILKIPFISKVLKIFQDLKVSLCKLKRSIISKILKIPIISKVVKIFKSIEEMVLNECFKPIAEKVNECFRSIAEKVKECFNVDFVDEMMYVSSEPFSKELWELFFFELQNKSEFADTPETLKRISSARGDWVLTETGSLNDRSKLLKYVTDVQYDESLLLWHIATDLCYYKDAKKLNEAENKNRHDSSNEKKLKDDLRHREFSKILSDYMLYLLIFQPTTMSAVAGIGKIRYQDTCTEAVRFFHKRGLRPNDDKKACNEILSVNTDVRPVTLKGKRSKSVLFDASMLAKELDRLERENGEDKWRLICRVWVELVSYAASHCRASTHAQQISKGGELITFFWLLMAHFGLGEQFQVNEGCARAKLILGK